MPSGRLADDCTALHDSLQWNPSAARRRHDILSFSSTPGCRVPQEAARRPHMQEGTVERVIIFAFWAI